MNTDNIAGSIENCFISPNVADSNMEPANVVDVMDRAARNLSRVADAITPGGKVESLTEAVIYTADSLRMIADAIGDLASAVRNRLP